MIQNCGTRERRSRDPEPGKEAPHPSALQAGGAKWCFLGRAELSLETWGWLCGWAASDLSPSAVPVKVLLGTCRQQTKGSPFRREPSGSRSRLSGCPLQPPAPPCSCKHHLHPEREMPENGITECSLLAPITNWFVGYIRVKR